MNHRTRDGSGLSRCAVLFVSFLYISLFVIGGGLVAIPLIRRRFVTELGWVGEQEILDIIALAQSAPGAFSVNAAVIIGYKTAGIAGVLSAAAGTAIIPFVIMAAIQGCYALLISNRYVTMALRGMNAAVAALILNEALKMGANSVRKRGAAALAGIAAVFVCVSILRINAALVIAVCIGISFAFAFAVLKKSGKAL